jgi:hypothetical protein
LLSVNGEVVDTDDGVPNKFSLLWTSPKFVGETGGDDPKKKLQLTAKQLRLLKSTLLTLSRNL